MTIHCPECGFTNPEGASYCSKCGAFLDAEDRPDDATTTTYRIGETGEIEPIELEEVVAGGAALVIRSGGGRTGESFALQDDRVAIGRRPDSGIFLDDVTVSRDHAVLVARGADYYLDDLGSLNGTYVNRQRVESHRLADGDELQIGKYKLTYRQRR
ncbi:MAG: FHA domain-containing protein [Solirubrobacteraceae bacterium]